MDCDKELKVHSNLVLIFNEGNFLTIRRPNGTIESVHSKVGKEKGGDTCMIPAKACADGLRLNLCEVYGFFECYLSSRIECLVAAVIIDYVYHIDSIIFSKAFVFVDVLYSYPIVITKIEFEVIMKKLPLILEFVENMLLILGKEYSERSMNFIDANLSEGLSKAHNELASKIFVKEDQWFIEQALRDIISPFYFAQQVYKLNLNQCKYVSFSKYMFYNTYVLSRFEKVQSQLVRLRSDTINRALRNANIRCLPVIGSLSLASTLICTFGELSEVLNLVDRYEQNFDNLKDKVENHNTLAKSYRNFVASLAKTQLFKRWMDNDFSFF